MNNFREIENGSVFVISSGDLKPVPLFCPLCEMPMQTQDDAISFRELGCCYLCDLEFRPNLLQYRLVEDNQLEEPQDCLTDQLVDQIRNDNVWNEYRKKRISRSKRTITLK